MVPNAQAALVGSSAGWEVGGAQMAQRECAGHVYPPSIEVQSSPSQESRLRVYDLVGGSSS